MSRRLVSAWSRRGPLACLLWPISLVYRLALVCRRALYAAGFFPVSRFNLPVIVVGNVVAGGAGKTPLVMALVIHFQAQGLKVGVVSRGYGRSGDETLEVTPETAAARSGDEPALIRRVTSAPVFVARRRADAVRALLAAYPQTDLVVCDDGLQHAALHRAIDIAVFDDRGLGNGWLLPAGPLREPWPRVGKQVDLVLHTGQRPAFSGFTSTRQLADDAIAADGRRVPLASLAGQPLVAFAGIASPDSFFAMLRDRGLVLAETLAFADHDDFQNEQLFALLARPGLTVLCTEKDAIKLFADPRLRTLHLLAVPLVFTPEPAFFSALDACLAKLPRRPG